MNRTAAETATTEIERELVTSWPASTFRRVADIIERACGQDDAIAGSCPSCRKAWVNGCADCGKPLFQTFKADDDGRVFHYECGGAEFAKRMSVLPGTPEFNRLRACGQADEQELPALPREFTTKKAKIGSIRERPVFPIEDEVGDRSCGETAWVSRVKELEDGLTAIRALEIGPGVAFMIRGIVEGLLPSPPTGRTEENNS